MFMDCKKVLIVAVTVVAITGNCEMKKSNIMKIESNDTKEVIIEKAANIIPTDRQWQYEKREFIAFIHFGPNTFTRKEWGNGKENPKIFNPSGVDTDQWCETMKAAGMTTVVLTCKHHDGFVLWQSRYSKHSVASSPWENGKGDVLKNLSKSCKKYGLKLGVYLSPADLYQMEAKDGLYGNLSKYSDRVIPRPVKGRPFKDKRTFNFKVDDYNEYFLNQLFELLTEYGPVHEVWFDGAHPKHKGGQTYTYQSWYKLIRELAPEAVIFGKGPDVRWCGNEAGKTRKSEWNVIPMNVHPDACDWPDLQASDIGSRKKLFKAKYLYYLPTETNTSIRHGWFYRDDTSQSVKNADKIFDTYERSVGGNSVFMLNIPPNREGKFSPRDVKCLKEVGKRIRDTYAKNLLSGAQGDRALFDTKEETFWSPSKSDDTLVVTLKKPIKINRIVIQEAVKTVGQRVEEYAVDAWVNGKWHEIAKGTVIGHKKIVRFSEVTTDKLRLRITESRLTPAISAITAHYYKKPEWISSAGLGELKGWISPKNWKVLEVNSEHRKKHSANKAFDGNIKTFWHTSWDKGHPVHPHFLAIDLAKEYTLKGFTYLPRQDKPVPDSMVEKGYIEVSLDGKKWSKVEDFEFGNLLNDPTARMHTFNKPVKGRYVKFVSTEGVSDKPYAGAAEIGLFE